jgi:hypothetical protein
MRLIARLMLTACFVLALGVAPALGAAASAGELTLDRSAVRELIALALPEPWELELPGMGTVTLRLDAPDEVHFREGGVEAELPLKLSGLGHELLLHVRFVPSVEPISGVVRLEPESIVPDLALPFEIDLRAWVPTVDLPRRLDWELELSGGKKTRVTCFVQGLTVEDKRLRVDLGLLAGK